MSKKSVHVHVSNPHYLSGVLFRVMFTTLCVVSSWDSCKGESWINVCVCVCGGGIRSIYSSCSLSPTVQCVLQLVAVWVTRGLKCKLIEIESVCSGPDIS